MIPLHITTTEWYGIAAMVVAMLAIVAYMSYRAGAVTELSYGTDVETDG